ncbi:MAG: SNF2-related protein [Candidatus Sumerlaeia bacterium]|nr:SNF2-related protein [Candidatus Sumerlaeia bacterium]
MLNPGDEVRRRSDPAQKGIVRGLAQEFGPLRYIEVFTNNHVVQVLEDEWELNSAQDAVGGWAQFQSRITSERLRPDRPLSNTLYSFGASRTLLMPHQIKPVLKFLESPKHRILIADEVGLGKTIEAGLILTELRARTRLNRVLILCPPSLTGKWQLELRSRFNEHLFEHHESGRLHQWLNKVEEGHVAPLHAISTFHTVRTDSMRERFLEVWPHVDLIIIDEAHHMRNKNTATNQMGRLFRDLCSHLILLTATPVQNGLGDLFSLLNLLDEEEFKDEQTAQARFAANRPIVLAQAKLNPLTPSSQEQVLQYLHSAAGMKWHEANKRLHSLINKLSSSATYIQDHLDEVRQELDHMNLIGHLMSRTKRSSIPSGNAGSSTRNPIPLLCDFSPAEMKLYQAFVRFNGLSASVTPGGKSGSAHHWASLMRQRMASSCLPACIDHIHSLMVAHATKQSVEVEEDSDNPNQDAPPSFHPLQAPPNIFTKLLLDARAELTKAAAEWEAHPHDAKLSRLRELLSGTNDKMLLFSFFRGTLRYLEKRLNDFGITTYLITGELTPEERPTIIQQFRQCEGKAVLLSSSVGTEGLDFQFCGALVNYDLPWNPMVIEQRIGRLDRIGQQHKSISIFNFWVKGTIEEVILRRLYDKLHVFEGSIGALEPILGELLDDAEMQALSMAPEGADPAVQLEGIYENVENLIDQKTDDASLLDTQVDSLFISDTIYDVAVAQAQRNRRFITSGQLIAYLRIYFEESLQDGSSIRQNSQNPRAVTLKVGSSLPERLRLFQEQSGLTVHGITAFLQTGNTVHATLDQQRAFDNPTIPFITALHPLVRLAGKELLQKSSSSDWLQYFQVEMHRDVVAAAHLDVEVGIYYFKVIVLTFGGVRNTSSLVSLFVSREHHELPPDVCEGLLALMVEKGATPSVDITLPSETLQGMKEMATTAIYSRVGTLHSSAKASNDHLRDTRKGSLLAAFERTRAAAIAQIEKRQAKLPLGASDPYIKGIETRIENAQKRLTIQLGELDGAVVTQEFDPNFADGLLLIRS